MNYSFTSIFKVFRPILVAIFSLLFSLQVFCQDAPAAAGNAEMAAKGQALFDNNCASCHAMDEVVVGPALRNVHTKHNQAWLLKWIKNSQALVASGDKQAVAIYEQYAKQAMPSFAFSDDEVLSILEYIKTAPAKATAAAPADGSTTEEAKPKEDAGFLNILLMVFIALLALIVIVLVLIMSVLTKIINQKDRLTEEDKYLIEQKFDIQAVITSKAFKFFVGFFFVCFIGKAGLDGLMDLGMQQGYAPKQPIPFSHKVHAGKYKIDCNYCHTGVNRSKSANIPSANICMNCHNAIKTDSPKLRGLFEAVRNNKPIEWVRVHNLPDLAYFNHAQHVKVGGLECKTCHGPIEEMEVVQQYSPLTMGWCINCHRETPVNTEGNGYYDKLVVLHKQTSKDPLKVKDIGGLECSKCHY
jgi:mono/diheme cytochrome c family protein